MKEIKLTQGQVAIVDDEDFERLNKFKWCVLKKRGSVKFCVGRTDYGRGKRTIRMHRVILNAPANLAVDHINGNQLDNRRANLRLATNQQNSFNRKYSQKNNRLGVKGVCFHRDRSKYKASIGYNGEKIYLGLFASLENADKAYRDAEVKYFGEFARQAMN